MIARTPRTEEFDSTMILMDYFKQDLEEKAPHTAHKWDENSVIKSVRHIQSHANAQWFNLYEGQRPVGFISGSFTTCPFNHDLINANIDLCYVIPSHRSYEAVRLLVEKLEEWASTHRVNEITITDTGIAGELQDYYTNMGYTTATWMHKEY